MTEAQRLVSPEQAAARPDSRDPPACRLASRDGAGCASSASSVMASVQAQISDAGAPQYRQMPAATEGLADVLGKGADVGALAAIHVENESFSARFRGHSARK
jgi:hypothetical protein